MKRVFEFWPKTSNNMEAIKVIFYKERDTKGVFAYFPEEIADGQFNRLCYAHIGQHSSCSNEYVKECRKAKESEYADLKTELESIGYNLQIIE